MDGKGELDQITEDRVVADDGDRHDPFAGGGGDVVVDDDVALAEKRREAEDQEESEEAHRAERGSVG
jgi:hypothetical protein